MNTPRLPSLMYGLGIALWLGSVAVAQDLIADDDGFYPRDPAAETLGRLLFFDKILSGNRDIACATCHHPLLATGDALSLTLGTGARGSGPARHVRADDPDPPELLPRHTPALFNLGAREFDALFHDGRLQVTPEGFITPDDIALPPGLDNVLAVQVMLNVISVREMAGLEGENPVADAVFTDQPDLAWERLAERLRAIPEYVEHFRAAFAEVEQPDDITLVHAADAIAAFESAAFRCTEAPFDRAVHGDLGVISPLAWRGAELFYNERGCAGCHSGPFLTDHEFHAIGVPQIGPGRGDNQPGYFDGLDDFGREQVTGDPADRFRFRTPSLRQVALTGPWGHDGAFASLDAMVRHHLDLAAGLENYNPGQARFPAGAFDPARHLAVQNDVERRAAIAAAGELPARSVDDDDIRALVAFLRETLTDYRCVERLQALVPERVPSGLPIAD